VAVDDLWRQLKQVALFLTIALITAAAIVYQSPLSRATIPFGTNPSSTNPSGTNVSGTQASAPTIAGETAASTPLVDTIPLRNTPSPELLPTIAPQISQGKVPNSQLVDIRTVNSKIGLDMRYATANNFLKRKVYAQARCLLRATAAERLAKVQKAIEKQGFALKVYDCYRPLSVQKEMWKLVPDSRYVADPAKGSRHNRGSAVDITMVNLKTKKELPMPTGFDDFSDRAHLDYQGGTAESRKNRDFLQQAMKQQGFLAIPTEWWHFDDPDWQKYSLLDTPLEKVK
jgi:zinc D-Ala-D-Ala dipeptidase